MKRAYADILEGQIHYRTEGSGRPLLLLHQTPLSSDEFSEVIPVLAKLYRVVAMDTMGYGNSDMPPHAYALEDYARSIVEFLDALDIGKTSVVGHHTGASFAVHLATAYPQRVDKLILSGCPHLEQEIRKTRLSDPRYKPVEIREDGSHLAQVWQYYRTRWSYLKPALWQRIMADYLRAGLGVKALEAYKAVYLYDIESRLRLISSPTLLMAGAGDVFYERLEATKQLIPKCLTKIIAGTHDNPAWENPVAFSQAILEFLAAGDEQTPD